MSSCDIFQGVVSIISVVSAATASYFAYSAIRQNKKNVFLHQRYLLALTVKELFYTFQSKWDGFKISEHSTLHRTLLNSEYYVSDDLYSDFLIALRELKKLEECTDATKRIAMAHVILPKLEQIKLNTRLDE
jgi:hypothetical protein